MGVAAQLDPRILGPDVSQTLPLFEVLSQTQHYWILLGSRTQCWWLLLEVFWAYLGS